MNLSTHLVDAYERKPVIPPQAPSRPTFPPHPSLATPHGNRSIDADTSWISGHGGFPDTSMTSTASGFSKWSEEKIAQMQVRLARKLGPEYVTQRPGPGGGPKLSYIEGWKVINLANEVFGFNGWSSSIVSLTTDFHDVNDQGRSFVNVTAIIRITLADGSWHEDVGCGQSENIKGKGAALDKAKKEAVTDATKRALRTFGNVLGNCMYDREYTKEVVKMKVPPAKFQSAELERRPEFTPAGAPGPSKAMAGPSRPYHNPQPVTVSVGNEPERPTTPLKSIDDLPEEDVLADESFDAEFLDDSFFQDVGAEGNATSTVQRPVAQAAQAMRPPPPAAPAYQHRHRPDVSTVAAQVTPAKPYDPAAAARRQAALMGATTAPADDKPLSGEHRQNQASGSSVTLNEPAPRKASGGYAMPDQRATAAGASARAAAISSMMRAVPPRSESPRIPSGGIDTVAAKAAHNFAARAADLGLEGEIAMENKVGFQSARKMKRASADDAGSPTKEGNAHLPARQPLADLGDTGQEPWSKKARAF